MKANQMREYIIRPALQRIDSVVPYTKVAEDLLLATACAESLCGQCIKQVGGPAEGFFQMEPATEKDIWDNYITFRLNIFKKAPGKEGELMRNLSYSVYMARIHYYRVSEPLPTFQADAYQYLDSLGKYWKKYYNTMAGKGTVEGFIDKAFEYGDFR